MSHSRFINLQHPNHLILHDDFLVGYHDSDGQSWTFINEGGNQFAIRNNPIELYVRPVGEYEGSMIKGVSEAFPWKLVPFSGGYYHIETLDGKYIWRMTGGRDYDPVVLEPSTYRGRDAEWAFEPTVRVE